MSGSQTTRRPGTACSSPAGGNLIQMMALRARVFAPAREMVLLDFRA
jgi:hypothetical protein